MYPIIYKNKVNSKNNLEQSNSFYNTYDKYSKINNIMVENDDYNTTQ